MAGPSSFSLSAWTLMLIATLHGLASAGSLTVDLGYATYTGYKDNTTGLNNFRGMRFAAPPVGDLRWQKPQPPVRQTSPIALSESWPPECLQSAPAPFDPSAVELGGNEDCLYLSVIAPPDAKDLPVLFFIHGGGYGSGNGAYEFNDLMKNNGNSSGNGNGQGFVYVTIQYRLAAFGFLSSGAMKGRGVANAGLWDVVAALQWTNSYINSFGGDPNRVTVFGNSAGGGAVMALILAEGGTWGTRLFQNAITSSPYLPQQYDLDGPVPESTYAAFASAAGCRNSTDNGTVFACLQAADSKSLHKANLLVDSVARYGTWGFLPVTDGEVLRDLPSNQLRNGSINGARILSANNANEGAIFVPAVANASAFSSWLSTTFPLMTKDELDNVTEMYAFDPVVPGQPLFATLGNSGPTALSQSSFAVGYPQAAFNLYAETTFVCPSYWLSDAFGRAGGESFHYQFSTPPSQHAGDINGYYLANSATPGDGTLTESFRIGMQKIFGNFIMHNDPTLSDETIAELSGKNCSNGAFDAASSRNWKAWHGGKGGSPMLNLNMTGGVEVATNVTYFSGETVNLTQYAEPGLSVAWSLVDAYTWEGGRGRRCEFWTDLGPSVPA